MAASKGTLALAVLLASLAAVFASAVEARLDNGDEAYKALVRGDLRVASTGYRLAVANVERCGRRMPATGLVLHSIAQYQGGWRQAALRYFGEIGDVSVEGVVAQSPAALAGIKTGGAIVAINGLHLERTTNSRQDPTKARDRAEDRLIGLPPGDRITLSIRRDGLTSTSGVMPAPACRSRFEMVAGSRQFALSDGRVVQVGQGLVEAVSDADLAVIIAHELAHTILEHRARLAELERSPDRRARKGRKELAREFEEQADRLSVHLLASAGYDPHSAPNFMRLFGTGFDKSSAADGIHGNAEARAKRMDEEIERMGSNSALPSAPR